MRPCGLLEQGKVRARGEKLGAGPGGMQAMEDSGRPRLENAAPGKAAGSAI